MNEIKIELFDEEFESLIKGREIAVFESEERNIKLFIKLSKEASGKFKK